MKSIFKNLLAFLTLIIYAKSGICKIKSAQKLLHVINLVRVLQADIGFSFCVVLNIK